MLRTDIFEIRMFRYGVQSFDKLGRMADVSGRTASGGQQRMDLSARPCIGFEDGFHAAAGDWLMPFEYVAYQSMDFGEPNTARQE